jgi:hypothetical protein
MKDTYEYRAYFPRDPHDSWVQGGYTPWETERELIHRLAMRSKLPAGLEDVKVFKRIVCPSVDVTSEFISLSPSKPF